MKEAKMKKLLVAAAMSLLAQVSANANLVFNGSNELALVAGEIQGWSEIVGTNWTQRSASPTAFDGSQYFFAGAGLDGTLRQNIDVSALASSIDAGVVAFDFSGYVQTFPQTPSDTSRIVLRFLAADLSVLGSFDSGEIVNTSAWQQVSHSSVALALTRIVQLDLLSHRNAGTNNDGYFDALSLEARTLTVPEPATPMLVLVAAAIAATTSRRLASR